MNNVLRNLCTLSSQAHPFERAGEELPSPHLFLYFVLLGLASLTKADSSSTVLGTLKRELAVLASISHKHMQK